jgi:hypothetical protein
MNPKRNPKFKSALFLLIPTSSVEGRDMCMDLENFYVTPCFSHDYHLTLVTYIKPRNTQSACTTRETETDRDTFFSPSLWFQKSYTPLYALKSVFSEDSSNRVLSEDRKSLVFPASALPSVQCFTCRVDCSPCQSLPTSLLSSLVPVLARARTCRAATSTLVSPQFSFEMKLEMHSVAMKRALRYP